MLEKGEILALGKIARLAWSEDTRQSKWEGYPLHLGQSFITAAWLKKRLGGHIARKEGRYFWVSSKGDYGLDLAADVGIVYKETKHPYFEGGIVCDKIQRHANIEDRTKLFIKRADRYFENLPRLKAALVHFAELTGIAFPAEEPQAKERIRHYWDDEPELEEDESEELKFLFANGHLEVSGVEDFDQLRELIGVDESYSGPLAAGHIDLEGNTATWHGIQTNVAPSALSSQIKKFEEQTGWEHGGVFVGNENNHENMKDLNSWDLKSTASVRDIPLIYAKDGLAVGGLLNRPIFHTDFILDESNSIDEFSVFGKARINGSNTAKIRLASAAPLSLVSKDKEGIYAGLKEWAEDNQLVLLGANDNVIERIEDLEIDSIYSPEQNQEERAFFPDDDSEDYEPKPFKCSECGGLFDTWRELMDHRRRDEAAGVEPREDGKFPELDFDAPIESPHFTEQMPQIFTLATVIPYRSSKEAKRIPGFSAYAPFEINDSETVHFVAYRHGSPIAFASVKTASLEVIEGTTTAEESSYYDEYRQELQDWDSSQDIEEAVEVEIGNWADRRPWMISNGRLFLGQNGVHHEDLWNEFRNMLQEGASPQAVSVYYGALHDDGRLAFYTSDVEIFESEIREALGLEEMEEEDWTLAKVLPSISDASTRVKSSGEVRVIHSEFTEPSIGNSLISSIQKRYPELLAKPTTPELESYVKQGNWTNVLVSDGNTNQFVWKWSANKLPKDLIEQGIPFIYDIEQDSITIGEQGQATAEMDQANFTPGGLVEGIYEPGGAVTIRSITSYPYSVRHILDLWQAQHPELEVSSLSMVDEEGKNIKLAHTGIIDRRNEPKGILFSDPHFATTVEYEPWKQGEYGKGLIYPDGSAFLWTTTEGGKYTKGDGQPSHQAVIGMLLDQGFTTEEPTVWIGMNPDGFIRFALGGEEGELAQAIPDLHTDDPADKLWSFTGGKKTSMIDRLSSEPSWWKTYQPTEHDYSPDWDYDVRDDQMDDPRLKMAQKRMDELAQSQETPFERGHVFPANLGGDVVGVYASGTYNEPVVLVDLDAHEGYEDQIGKTVEHEIVHAIQESNFEGEGEWADEDDAEGHVFGKAAASGTPYEYIESATGARWDGEEAFVYPDGTKVYLDLKDDGYTLYLYNIRAEPEGTGAGSEVLAALKGYALTTKQFIRAIEVMSPEYFQDRDFEYLEDEDEVEMIWKMDHESSTRTAATDQIVGLVASDPTANAATQALQAAGGKVYAVGGAVRDAIRGQDPKDIDLMVSGLDAERVSAALNKLPGRVDITGKDFGVFRYKDGQSEVEIALPRRERSTGEAHTDFEVQADPTMSVEEDLERRDYSANAMAVDLQTGELIDPFGGADDIEQGVLRAHRPESLSEDPLRVLRGLVARARHGLVPDDETKRLMAENAEKLQHISPERIQMELDKMFSAAEPHEAIRLARDIAALKYFLPEVDKAFEFGSQRNKHHELELGDHLLEVLRRAVELSDDPDLRMTALMHDVGKPDSFWEDDEGWGHFYRKKFDDGTEKGQQHEEVGADLLKKRLNDLRYPADRIKRMEELSRGHMFAPFTTDKGARRFLNQYGDLADDLMVLREADQGGKTYPDSPGRKIPDLDKQWEMINRVREQKAPTQKSQLAINGGDLINAGIPEGPEIGRVLNALMDAVVDNPELNSRDALLELAKNV